MTSSGTVVNTTWKCWLTCQSSDFIVWFESRTKMGVSRGFSTQVAHGKELESTLNVSFKRLEARGQSCKKNPERIESGMLCKTWRIQLALGLNFK